jgi:hypothetical protein
LTLDPATFDEELRQELTKVRLENDHGRVLMPVVPLDLGIVTSDIYGIQDEDEAFARAQAELGMRPLVTLEWQEDGAPTFDNSLQALQLGDRVYISVSPDVAVAQHWEAIALCDPGSPEMLEAFFLDLASDNGARYSVDLYSALPTGVYSDFLSREAVAASFAAYLNWDEARSPGAWRYAAEYIPRSVGAGDELILGRMALRKDDSESARMKYINAYADAVYRGPKTAVAN